MNPSISCLISACLLHCAFSKSQIDLYICPSEPIYYSNNNNNNNNNNNSLIKRIIKSFVLNTTNNFIAFVQIISSVFGTNKLNEIFFFENN